MHCLKVAFVEDLVPKDPIVLQRVQTADPLERTNLGDAGDGWQIAEASRERRGN